MGYSLYSKHTLYFPHIYDLAYIILFDRILCSCQILLEVFYLFLNTNSFMEFFQETLTDYHDVFASAFEPSE